MTTAFPFSPLERSRLALFFDLQSEITRAPYCFYIVDRLTASFPILSPAHWRQPRLGNFGRALAGAFFVFCALTVETIVKLKAGSTCLVSLALKFLF
jgi:hypothetical protein